MMDGARRTARAVIIFDCLFSAKAVQPRPAVYHISVLAGPSMSREKRSKTLWIGFIYDYRKTRPQLRGWLYVESGWITLKTYYLAWYEIVFQTCLEQIRPTPCLSEILYYIKVSCYPRHSYSHRCENGHTRSLTRLGKLFVTDYDSDHWDSKSSRPRYKEWDVNIVD